VLLRDVRCSLTALKSGDAPMTEQPYPLPPQIPAEAGAAFTCDFAISKDFSPRDIVPMIERDRAVMTARPGFLRKFIPLRIDPASGDFLSGGRYLFRTAQDARQYQTWLWHDFVQGGVAFFDRPFFLHPECHVWDVVGVADLAPYDEQQVVLRTERFQVPAAEQDEQLAARWSQVLTEARRRELTGVWLLHNEPEQLVSLVYFAERSAPLTPDELDTVTLEQGPPLGDVFADQGWRQTFDRTQWVLTIWFPSGLGEDGRPPLWPNSPPLPGPAAPTTTGDHRSDYPGPV
jgi:hypothetical protein